MNNIYQIIDALNSYFGFPQGLLLLIAYQENGRTWNFNTTASSFKGAKGMMQIMPSAIAQIRQLTGFSINPYNAVHSIWGAGVMLRWLYTYFGNWRSAIAAYNAGFGTIRNNIKKYGYLNVAALPRETQDYLFVADYLGV